jgi:molybdopterin synthase catalytic subunit
MSTESLSQDSGVIVAVHDGPVSVVELDWPGGCGGECVFLGRTRGESHGEFGPLVRLEYEVYEPMATKVLGSMAKDAAKKFGCRAVRLVHARGSVAPGEASVVIQVATPHRGEAFEACRYLIDRLKHDLPVWKREVWRDGETFVDGCCAGDGERLAERPDADENQGGVDHDG